MMYLKKFIAFSILLFIISTFYACKNSSGKETSVPDLPLPGILSTLQRAHPRLLLTDARLDELKNLSVNDLKLKKYAADVVLQADKDLVKAPIEHILIGPRLLDKSRRFTRKNS